MAIFGLYFTKNMLDQTGWPRKKGLLGKPVVDSIVLDGIINQMIDWAASIGAGRPKLALQVLAYIYKEKDWDSKAAPDIKRFVEESKWNSSTARAPHEVVNPNSISEHFGPVFSQKGLADKRFSDLLENYFVEGLLYGFSEKKRYEIWYAKSLEDFEKNRQTYKKSGLDVDELPSQKQTYEDGEAVVKDYVGEMQVQLPPIPQKLLKDARSIRPQ